MCHPCTIAVDLGRFYHGHGFRRLLRHSGSGRLAQLRTFYRFTLLPLVWPQRQLTSTFETASCKPIRVRDI